MRRDLRELIDLDGLSPAECERLARVHALLYEAGPPDELPSTLMEPPRAARGGAEVIPLRRRRPVGALLIAASLAAVCFGCGYVIADEAHPTSVRAVEEVSLGGQHDSFAALRVGAADSDGNQPVQLTVRGLPPLSDAHLRYALVITRGSRPASVIGMFRVGQRGVTTVTFSVPFAITAAMHFAVTETAVSAPQTPGHVVMTDS